MLEYPSAFFCLIAGGLLLTAGCVTHWSPITSREQLLKALEQELHANTGWVRIHAAEALLDHRETQAAAQCLGPEAATADAPYRIGVWRVLSRAATAEAGRAQLQERIRRVMLDPKAADRLHAAESLAKLGIAQRADRPALRQWLETADTATSPFLHWLLFLPGDAEERIDHEAMLVRLLDSTDPVARLRAAVALGRLQAVAPDSAEALTRKADAEATNSLARVYLLVAALIQGPKDTIAAARQKEALSRYLTRGNPHEQLEAATALGQCGAFDQAPALERLLKCEVGDARIGAATGLLYLRK